MLNNHHDIDQNISFLGKYFFSLVIRSYLYQKQLNQHTKKSLVHLLLFHLIKEEFVKQIWNYCISNKIQGLLLYNQLMVIYLPLSLRHSLQQQYLCHNQYSGTCLHYQRKLKLYYLESFPILIHQ